MTGELEDLMLALYHQYQNAISSGSVEEALGLGERYYRMMHQGEITPEDREQLQRDALLCVANRNKSE